MLFSALYDAPVPLKTQISAKLIKDSVCGKHRLTTMEFTYPRFIHSELMTHRVFSRNASSSRAIPIAKMIERVLTDTAKPVSWRSAKPGMQPGADLDFRTSCEAAYEWAQAAQDACDHARKLEALGVAKEITNRLLEPFLWMTTIVTATDWSNFFSQRTHPDAQKEFQVLACAAADAYFAGHPDTVQIGDYHLPYIKPKDKDEVNHYAEARAWRSSGENNPFFIIRLVSTARCARVSYLNHDGQRDIDKDIELGRKLLNSGHWSAFEHVAEGTGDDTRWGNFIGWKQFRKVFPRECVMLFDWPRGVGQAR